MKLQRRRILTGMAAAMALPAIARIARAESYPTRPVRIMVGYLAGSSSDISARLIAQSLSERLGQPFVVENRSGAGTNIATEAVAHAPPDGYTLLFATQTNAINATLYGNLRFNFIREIAPVASLIRVAGVMEVNPSFPATTVAEFIAYAKANPGKINMASGGNGSAQHLYGELFMLMTGVNMTHIPYPRINPLIDLLAEQVQVIFGPMPSSIDLIKAGKLRALGVTTATRLESLPDIPTVAVTVPGYEASGWFGIGAPKDTPAAIVGKLNQEINAALTNPTMKARIADIGGLVLAGSTADFARLIAADTDKWGKVVRAAGVNLD